MPSCIGNTFYLILGWTFCKRGPVQFWTLKQINDIYKYKNTTLWCMNNAALHVCISIIQINHYIYSIIFSFMNYSPLPIVHVDQRKRDGIWMEVASLIVECYPNVYLSVNTLNTGVRACLRTCVPPPGPSGRGRRLWAWSCWLRLATTRHSRGCSRPPISTHRAWCPTWTPERPSTCTGAPRRHRRQQCRDHWCRGSCCTACRAAASQHLRRRLHLPPSPECFPGRLSSGELRPFSEFLWSKSFPKMCTDTL